MNMKAADGRFDAEGNNDEEQRGDHDDIDDDGDSDIEVAAVGKSLSASTTLEPSTSVQENQELSSSTSRLAAVLGRVRLFSPEEMLALSGFPPDFVFPPDMPLRHRFQCIGNSVNVRVVQAVMRCLFDEATIPPQES